MIKVLLVDDSKVVRMLLRAMIEQEDGFEVVGEAENGAEGVELTTSLKPDVVTMDIRMPIMDGFEATKAIMRDCPTPILVVSASVNDEDLKITFNALQAGALGVIEKPPGLHGDDYDSVKRDLINSLRAYHEIKVVRRRYDTNVERVASTEVDSHALLQAGKVLNEVVAIGASTGGPALLGEILKVLPVNFSIPIVVVQHISEGFTPGLASWLNDSCQLIVKVAEQDEILRPGVVYIAPYGAHSLVSRNQGMLCLKLARPAEKKGFCPAVNELFRSVAACCPGHAIGVILTGMGDDGAQGLLEMKKAGCYTIGQDEDSCVVYGMPKEAMSLGAVCIQLPDIEIGKAIKDNFNQVQDARKRGRA
ncbi:MAG: chemotaxis-specific protein-glutamate methyltransferase CheB [Coxiellaceae bacterium]|nr:chemotaxis-specific protein-glutamate methyltransferase CheB [Coxiellaceae bacterium]